MSSTRSSEIGKNFDQMSCPKKFRAIAGALGKKVKNLSLEEASTAACEAVDELVKEIGLPLKLKEIGVEEEYLDKIAEDALTHGMIKTNPRQPTKG